MTTTTPPLDPTAIARLAAEARTETPDAVIRRELRRAGIRGTSALGMRDCADTRSAEWRAAYLACEREWRAITYGRPETERHGPRQRYPGTQHVTATVLWHAYQRGESQADIARRFSTTRALVAKRSYRLGFRLRPGGRPGEPRLLRGPCLECGRPRPVEALNQYRRCRGGCDHAYATEAA